MGGRLHGTVDQSSDAYQIRLARPDEIDRVREIEDEAGTIFLGTGMIDESLDISFPLDELVRLVADGQVWVACDSENVGVGMVVASVHEGEAYVEEMDVLPAHGRRGLGTRLLATVCEWAQAQGHVAITLSTFRDVPWNGPFYRRNGFRDLEPEEWTSRMRAIREDEARHGLRVEARSFMRRDFDRGM
jgi:4-diphosphocytidyl-2-C-methyl-D-erythritol kinase